MATAAAENPVRMIPLASINFNPNNPRKSHDKGALKELAESIKAHGVIQPIVVRPDGTEEKRKTFELVVGERRVRASKLALLEQIPAIVRDLSDREALEIMVIENDQREDPHPLDQSRGYKSWLTMPDEQGRLGTAEELAQKTGNSISWIYARLKLLDLIPAAQEALDQAFISAGHAVLIARLQPIDQVKALLAVFNESFDPKADSDPSLKLGDLIDLNYGSFADLGIIPEKGLREWIQDNVNLKLKGVPWDLNDAALVLAAGACSTCPKRSASNPALFAELTIKGEDTCFDAECFQGKRQAFVQLEIKKDRDRAKDQQRAMKAAGVEPGEKQIEDSLRQLSEQTGYTKPKPDQAILKAGQWLPAKKGECASVETGLIVRGENAGQRRIVCCNASCKIHKHHLSDRGTSFNSGGGAPDYEAEEFARHKRDITNAKKTAARRLLVREILSKVGAKLPIAILRGLVAAEVRTDWSAGAAATLSVLGVKAGNPCQKLKEMVENGSEAVLNKLLVVGMVKDADHADDKKQREDFSGIAKAVGIKNPHGILSREDDRIHKLKACRECGCTEETPCHSSNGVACSWKLTDLCSNPKCLARSKEKQTSTKPAKAKKA